LSKVEFKKFLSKGGIFLTEQELREIYNQYDYHQDGQINYAEFIQYIRTSMSENRLSAVKYAYQFLDYDRVGKLPIGMLFSKFKAKEHPRVRTREKTEEQVFADFKAAIVKKR